MGSLRILDLFSNFLVFTYLGDKTAKEYEIENSGLKTYFEINIGQFFEICFFYLSR